MPSNDEWQDWLFEIKKQALKEGITQSTSDSSTSNNVLTYSRNASTMPLATSGAKAPFSCYSAGNFILYFAKIFSRMLKCI